MVFTHGNTKVTVEVNVSLTKIASQDDIEDVVMNDPEPEDVEMTDATVKNRAAKDKVNRFIIIMNGFQN